VVLRIEHLVRGVLLEVPPYRVLQSLPCVREIGLRGAPASETSGACARAFVGSSALLFALPPVRQPSFAESALRTN
jgi:hypothetical protein